VSARTPGRSVSITDGLSRLTAAATEPIRIDLCPTAHRFGPGHRIRLQISSGAHPRHAAGPFVDEEAGLGGFPAATDVEGVDDVSEAEPYRDLG
jgi:uncharacterized protein